MPQNKYSYKYWTHVNNTTEQTCNNPQTSALFCIVFLPAFAIYTVFLPEFSIYTVFLPEFAIYIVFLPAFAMCIVFLPAFVIYTVFLLLVSDLDPKNIEE